MTVADLINLLSSYSKQVIALFCFIPAFSFIYGKIHAPGKGVLAPHKYIYSVLIYSSCVPGMLAAIIVGYSVFFLRTNLLEVNFFIYFLPIISLVVTLVIIRKNVELDDIPGFDRLVGLCTLLGITFVLTLLIMKTRILSAVIVFSFGINITNLQAQCSDAGICQLGLHFDESDAKKLNLGVRYNFGYSGKDDDIQYHTIQLDASYQLAEKTSASLILSVS